MRITWSYTMIENDYISLGKRVVTCKGWRWMPGMRWRTEDDRGRLDDFQPEYMGRPPDALPDLTDPATLGCLLALVREAWGDKAVIHIENNNWFYVETDGRHLWDEDNASSLLAALVAALEAAR